MKLLKNIRNIMSHGKKAWFINHINDQYVKKAQTCNFRSRAAFKLLQIQEKYNIVKKASTILDLGSAPGSWCQAAKTINPANSIVAVDLLLMKQIQGIDFYQTDARNPVLLKTLKEKYTSFDVIISDMAPNFTGTLFQTHQQMIQLNKLCLQLNLSIGSANSHLIMKTVQGDMQKSIVWLLQKHFKEVIRFKPKSSRSESVEHYLLCKSMFVIEEKASRLDLLKKLQLKKIKSKKDLQKVMEI